MGFTGGGGGVRHRHFNCDIVYFCSTISLYEVRYHRNCFINCDTLLKQEINHREPFLPRRLIQFTVMRFYHPVIFHTDVVNFYLFINQYLAIARVGNFTIIWTSKHPKYVFGVKPVYWFRERSIWVRCWPRVHFQTCLVYERYAFSLDKY